MAGGRLHGSELREKNCSAMRDGTLSVEKQKREDLSECALSSHKRKTSLDPWTGE